MDRAGNLLIADSGHSRIRVVAATAALGTGPVRWRLWTAVFAAATIPLGALVAIEAQVALVTAGLATLLVLETRSPAEAGDTLAPPQTDGTQSAPS